MPKRDIKDGSLNFRKHVDRKTHMRDAIAQKNSFGDVFPKDKTHKRDIGHQTPSGGIKIPEREDNRRLTPNGGSVKTLRRESRPRPTPKRDNSIKAFYGDDDKTIHGDLIITPNGDKVWYLTLIGAKLSMH